MGIQLEVLRAFIMGSYIRISHWLSRRGDHASGSFEQWPNDLRGRPTFMLEAERGEADGYIYSLNNRYEIRPQKKKRTGREI